VQIDGTAQSGPRRHVIDFAKRISTQYDDTSRTLPEIMGMGLRN
jgi:hypothetical protein